MSGATWLGGPMCLCWYGWFGMSSCAPWDCSGLGIRLTLSPVVTCLLAEPQPMLTFFNKPPRPCTPEECRSAVVLGCCTPATLFIPKEFPCVFGPRNLALFWFSPIRLWLLCCWNWLIQELGWQSVPIPNLRSDGEGLIFEPDPLGRWQDMDCRSFSGPLLEDWEGFWPKEIPRKTDYNYGHLSAFEAFLTYQKCTVPVKMFPCWTPTILLDCLYSGGGLVRWRLNWSCVLSLSWKRKAKLWRLIMWLINSTKFSQSLNCLLINENNMMQDVAYWIVNGVLLLVKLSRHGLSFGWAFLLVVGCWGPWLRLGCHDS